MPTGFEQTELNYVASYNFYMVIDLMPTVQYNLQQVTIPTISGGEAELANRLNPGKTFVPGNSLDYGTLDCTFLIDKRFQTYREILKWMKAINHPDTHDTYRSWVNDVRDISTESNFKNTMSDIEVFATDASGTPLAEWKFRNAFPISLDGPQYDSSTTETEYLTSTVSFRFTHFEHDIYNDSGANKNQRI